MSSSESERPSDRKNLGNIGTRIQERIDKIQTYLQITRATGIIRRYFIMNAFDGAMTSLGVVIGSYITGIEDPRTIIGVILISGLAMAISGFSGTYMTESAERSHSLDLIENAMLTNLDKTLYGRASQFVSIFAALVDGSAPFLATIPSILPFSLLHLTGMSIHFAFYSSIGAGLFVLFILGVYLGRLSRSNIFISGFKMVVAGTTVALIALLLGGH